MVLAPGALAQKPPGNGAVDEYTEGIPGSGGETPSGDSGNGGGGSGDSTLSPSVAGALESQGADGAATAALAEATAPSGADQAPQGTESQSSASDSDSSVAPSTANASDPDGLAAAVDAVTGEGEDGMGFLLPILLGAIALGVILLVLRRQGDDAGTAG
jgi:hypothetical protein